jgi:hypothetical protein
MAKTIEVNKSISRDELDKKIKTLSNQKPPINLDKYFGKINFGVDGLDYQLKMRR